LVTLLDSRLRETDTTFAAGSFLPLRGRVACMLLELAQDFGQDVGARRIVIHQKIGQSDLAAMAGIARENVSRILNDWKRRKLVSHITIASRTKRNYRKKNFSGALGAVAEMRGLQWVAYEERTKIHSIVIDPMMPRVVRRSARSGDARFRPSTPSHRPTINTVCWACCIN
jgi:Crp-like helix-turn-helix domain